MNKLVEVMRIMAEEVDTDAAKYHWTDDGETYRLLRNDMEVAGVSHGYADANPMVKRAIEACFADSKD